MRRIWRSFSEILDLLESRSIPEPNSGCRLWEGSGDEKGYGFLTVNGRNWRVHRLRWTLVRGQIPKELEVCHKCDVRCCINLDHLSLDTHAGNMADMKAKGRQRACRGETNPSVKLSVSQVQKILAERRPWQAVAADYEISKTQYNRILRGVGWKHLRAEPEATDYGSGG